MIHASLFSGIGGSEIAAQMLGWENAFHCEINQFCRAVLKYWFPNAVSYGDIFKTDFTPWRGKIDVLSGGFPCQPFSLAGTRKGSRDNRYLWPQMLRAIDEIRPTWVCGENVAGLTSMVEQGKTVPLDCQTALFDENYNIHRYRYDQSFTIEKICTDLECIGYSVETVIIPACAVGAPHLRNRLFILAFIENVNAVRRQKDEVVEHAQKQGNTWTTSNEGRISLYDANTASSESRQHFQQTKDSVEGETRHEKRTESGRPATNTASNGNSRRPRQVCGEERRPSELNAKPCINGEVRHAADTDCIGHSAQAANGESESGRRSDNGEPCQRSESTEWIERFHPLLQGDEAGLGRWQNFPSVSPVHRGNDGLPFSLDDLTISWGKNDVKKRSKKLKKWRTEALRAYGNAIVPQVIYEIFRAIEIASTNHK